LRAWAWHWLAALNKAVNHQFPEGPRGGGLNLMSDNGCQPTSLSFMAACRIMGIN
jgi:transposase InsO family protein